MLLAGQFETCRREADRKPQRVHPQSEPMYELLHELRDANSARSLPIVPPRFVSFLLVGRRSRSNFAGCLNYRHRSALLAPACRYFASLSAPYESQTSSRSRQSLVRKGNLMMIPVRLLSLWMVTVMLGAFATATQADDPLVFVSSFVAKEQGAIHCYRLDEKTGTLSLVTKTSGVENPFFLALSPDKKTLFSIHAKQFGGKEHEHVASFEVLGRSGELKLINRASAKGTAACYLHVDATGKTVLVANYSSGSVASLPVGANGTLSESASFVQHVGSSVNPARQKEPHAHAIITSPDNKFVYAADLGLDQVLCYRLDATTSKLTANDPPFAKTPAGAGPRHLTFHPNGKHLYVINELLNSVTVFAYDALTGALTEQQTLSTLPADFKGTSYCADLKITPNGRFLYGTNRGHDSIAAYRIGDDGKLALIAITPSLGKGPQNLAITPNGELLLCANMPGKNVAVFRIDGATGTLTSTGAPTEMPSPSCIMLLP